MRRSMPRCRRPASRIAAAATSNEWAGNVWAPTSLCGRILPQNSPIVPVPVETKPSTPLQREEVNSSGHQVVARRSLCSAATRLTPDPITVNTATTGYSHRSILRVPVIIEA
jgi:hypothetical protein